MSKLAHYFLPHHSNNQRARILHPTSIFLVIIAFSLFQIFLNQLSFTFPNILGYASQISPAEIIRLTNIERQNNGLSLLKTNSQLSTAASQKAGDMFARNYWAHVSPQGTQPWFFVSNAGYNYRYAGENLARDFTSPSAVVAAWMDSTTHRDNILNPRYQDIGVAVVDGSLSGSETTLVVQMFGTKLESQPVSEVSSSFTVSAQEETLPTPVPTSIPLTQASLEPSTSSLTTPFSVTKTLSLLLLGLLLIVILADVIIVSRKKLIRWTSKGLAHLIFLGALIIAVAIIIQGQII